MARAHGARAQMPALAFANAPRMHAGGWAGIKPDEVPAILQKGERVLFRAAGITAALIHGDLASDKGQGRDGKPHNIWIAADGTAREKLATFAAWANREGAAVYVIPGTVAEQGQARAADVLQMQALVVDLDAGDIPAKLDHIVSHLGVPTLIVESGGRTPEGAAKLHVWWKLTEPADGEDLATLCRLRGDIAVKVGGDTHFRSAHQPIRVAGTVYHKHGHQRLVQIRPPVWHPVSP